MERRGPGFGGGVAGEGGSYTCMGSPPQAAGGNVGGQSDFNSGRLVHRAVGRLSLTPSVLKFLPCSQSYSHIVLGTSLTPMHGFRGDIATHCPRPWGGGGARSAGGVGLMRCVDQSEMETGEGETPSPSAPPPMAIATTVHCMRTCPIKRGAPGTSRVRHQPRQGKDEDQNRVSTERAMSRKLIDR